MLGKGDPSVDEDFFRFVVKDIEIYKKVHNSGQRVFIVVNKRDFPRYDWLTDARVELDGKEFIVKEVIFWNLNPIAIRKGEEIGLLVVPG